MLAQLLRGCLAQDQVTLSPSQQGHGQGVAPLRRVAAARAGNHYPARRERVFANQSLDPVVLDPKPADLIAVTGEHVDPVFFGDMRQAAFKALGRT
ncbi:MAG: hypothetical protein KFB96_19020 [Thiocapsa sp.]|uniref:hypothetical protein n=1 Tax=Thiocapsa sp. TaxID=2024551 RepID=UPI001BCEA836|nr:hypothetical protein [Thiocapsa sp.]QVL47754.1 MAG: hypothetical protein KFB96_19020 [Thiocapsa sp.]